MSKGDAACVASRGCMMIDEQGEISRAGFITNAKEIATRIKEERGFTQACYGGRRIECAEDELCYEICGGLLSQMAEDKRLIPGRSCPEEDEWDEQSIAYDDTTGDQLDTQMVKNASTARSADLPTVFRLNSGLNAPDMEM